MKSSQLVFWAAFGFTLSSLSLGGTLKVTGRGESSAPPDRFQIDIKVMSICYNSTQKAKNDNAQIANPIINIGKKYLRTPFDQVNSYPGSFLRETEYIPSENGHSKILCERRWKTWNTIRLTVHDISSLPELQNELVTFLEPMEAVLSDRTEQTFVQISSPEFSLTHENHKRLIKESQEAALQDAKNQFENFDANCHFGGAKLTSLSSPNFSSVLRYASKSAEETDLSTPVIPESISVNAVWNFIWEFESAPGCYN